MLETEGVIPTKQNEGRYAQMRPDDRPRAPFASELPDSGTSKITIANELGVNEQADERSKWSARAKRGTSEQVSGASE